MTTAVLGLLESYLIKNGEKGRERVCKAVGKTRRTLDRWQKDGIPDPHDAYKLALACGCSEKEALRLAREEASVEVGKETA